MSSRRLRQRRYYEAERGPLYRSLTELLPPFKLPRLLTRVVPRSYVHALEDRRLFRPDRRVQPVRSVFRGDTRLVVGNRINKVKFAVPDNVAVCAKRKRRREVLFAKLKTGAGSRAKRRRRNEWSEIGC